MKKFNKKNLKLAIQKEGRLTDETLSFLRRSGLEFESYKQKLFSTCRNFPLEIIFVRDNDIPNFVSEGIVDLGIVGQNLLYEKKAKVKKLLNLRYGFCSLIIAVPRDSLLEEVKDLKGKKLATSYPESTKSYFNKLKVSVELVDISGSLEITPALGIADAISDLTSSGSTLVLNDLKVITKIYDSEAVLITNSQNTIDNIFAKKLISRFKGVLSAKNYKYIIVTADEKNLNRLKKIIPGIKKSVISSISPKNRISIASIVKEDVFWDTTERLRANGADGVFVIPIEKMFF